MARVTDWQTALQTVITDAESESFEYGTFDCCIFANSCIKAITGEDPYADFSGTYSSRKEALAALRSYDHGNLIQATDYLLNSYGWNRINVHTVIPGDIVCIRDHNNCPSLAVVDFTEDKVIVPSQGGGVFSLPLYNAFIVWGIR